jgi:hypothetical protein
MRGPIQFNRSANSWRVPVATFTIQDGHAYSYVNGSRNRNGNGYKR